MNENDISRETGVPGSPEELRGVIREVIGEFLQVEKTRTEPAHKAELAEERRRREQLEHRLNDLVQENQRARLRADEAERDAAIRGELQRLGVGKLDLAYRVVKEDIVRNEQGKLIARDAHGEMELRDYLARFVQENPELMPARVSGGSGVTLGLASAGMPPSAVDLDKIRPGMDPEELDRVRREIARIASQSLMGK